MQPAAAPLRSGGRRRKKFVPLRFPAVAEDHEMEPETEDWVCKSCGAANLWALLTCEGCGHRRTSDASIVDDTNLASLAASAPQHPPKSGRILGLRKWPSLQQAAEKSWEICDQSSVASSMIDIARLSDLEGTHDNIASVVDVAVDAESCLHDICQPTGPGESAGSEHADDEVSLADSWCHASKLDLASVASSWQDVGHLPDVETCSIGSWLQITPPDDKQVAKAAADAAAQPIAGSSELSQAELEKACVGNGSTDCGYDKFGQRVNTPNRHAVIAAEEHQEYDCGYAHIRFRDIGQKAHHHRRARAGRHYFN